MNRKPKTHAYYEEKYARLIHAVKSGLTVDNAAKLMGISSTMALRALHLAGYRRKWVKINDDGSEDHLDAWE